MSEIRSQATPARDELAGIIHVHVCANNLEDCTRECHLAAAALEKAGWSKPRTVNSVTELDALPAESVALFGITPGYKRHDGLWETSGVNDRFTTNEVFESLGGQPATVLFTPGDAG